MNATLIMPPLVCTCDRYWGNTQNCRMPTAPQDMPLPFRCSQARGTRVHARRACACTSLHHHTPRLPRICRGLQSQPRFYAMHLSSMLCTAPTHRPPRTAPTRLQDALFEVKRWNDLHIRFREASYLLWRYLLWRYLP